MAHERLRGIISYPGGAMAAYSAMGAHGVDLGQIKDSVEEANKAFADFRERQDAKLADLARVVEAQEGTIAALRVGGDGSSGAVHPGAGMRTGRRAAPMDSQVRDEVRAAMMGAPSATMRTSSGPDGGFTVPVQVDTTIDALLRDASPLRGLARVVPLGDGNGSWSKIIARRGAGSSWAGEEDTRSETGSPQLGRIEITPHEHYALPELTNHVIEDSSFDLEGFLEEDVAGEFSLTESLAFVNGDGIKKPRGFLTYDATTQADAARDFGKLQYLATGVNGGFPASNPADILFDLVTKLARPYRMGDGVAWLMNSSTANVIRKFKDSTGRHLWADSMAAGQPDRLCGYPVAIDEGMPDIGNGAVPIAFGNWRRGYAIVDRTGLSLLVDRLTRKGWTRMYFTRRVGGAVLDSNAIKLLKFSVS